MKTLKYILVSSIVICSLALSPQTKAVVFPAVSFLESQEETTIFCLTHLCASTIVTNYDYNHYNLPLPKNAVPLYAPLYIVNYAGTNHNLEGSPFYTNQVATIYNVIDICYGRGIYCTRVSKESNGDFLVSYYTKDESSPSVPPKKPGETLGSDT